MFAQITQSGKRVVFLARQAAIRLRHEGVEAGHLLVGVLEGDNLACRVLEQLEVSTGDMKRQAEMALGVGDHTPEMDHMKFTDSAKKVLVSAIDEANTTRGFTGTGHLLLGLVRTDASPAQLLAEFGVTADGVRAAYGEMDQRLEGVPDQQVTSAAARPRFTKVVERAMKVAMRRAAELRNDWIGAEHILLGVIAVSSGVAVRALQTMGVDLDAVQREIESNVNGAHDAAEKGKGPFTPLAATIMRDARHDAAAEHRALTTGDLLVSLIQEECSATTVLNRFGAGDENVRQAVAEIGADEL